MSTLVNLKLTLTPVTTIGLSIDAPSQQLITTLAPFYVGAPGAQSGLLDISALPTATLLPGDLLIMERNGNQYKITADGMKTFLGIPVEIDDPFGITHTL